MPDSDSPSVARVRIDSHYVANGVSGVFDAGLDVSAPGIMIEAIEPSGDARDEDRLPAAHSLDGDTGRKPSTFPIYGPFFEPVDVPWFEARKDHYLPSWRPWIL